MLTSFGLSVAAYLLLVGRFVPARALVPGWAWQPARDQWRFSAHVSGYLVMATAFMQSDKLVVTKLLPLSSFGYYSLVWTVIWKVASLASAVNTAAFPSLVAALSAGSGRRVRRQYWQLQDLVCHACVVPMVALPFGLFPAFTYVFGVNVADRVVVPVLLLTAAYYMHTTLSVPLAVAGATGHPELIMKTNLIAVFTFLPALIGLVLTLGLTGAGLAWLGYYGLAYAYLVPRLCRVCLEVPALSWYSHVAGVLLKVAATYGIGWPLCFVAARSSGVAWLAAFVAASALFVGLSLLSGQRRGSVRLWNRSSRLDGAGAPSER
jgi:O-antigen/teichoic acid export membrane protein